MFKWLPLLLLSKMGEGIEAKLKVDNSSVRQCVRLEVDAVDMGGENAGIAKVVILEDGKPIHENTNHLIYTPYYATSAPGKRVYWALVFDNDGNLVKTNEVVVDYTGFTASNLPEVHIKASLPECRRTTRIEVFEHEGYSDIHGVEWIQVYEDGQPLDFVFAPPSLTNIIKKEVTHEQTGKHLYNAEVKYKDGPIVKTETIEVDYKGIESTLLPKATISTKLSDAGRSTKLSVWDEDKYDNEGVETVRVFEDGKLVYTNENPSL